MAGSRRGEEGGGEGIIVFVKPITKYVFSLGLTL